MIVADDFCLFIFGDGQGCFRFAENARLPFIRAIGQILTIIAIARKGAVTRGIFP